MAKEVKITLDYRLVTAAVVVLAAVLAYVFWPESSDQSAEVDRQQAQSPVASEVSPMPERRLLTESGEIIPSFDVVRVSRSGTGVIAGTAAPDAIVEVFANGQLIGTVSADSNGEWVMIPAQPLNPGSAEMTIRSTLPGKDPIESIDVVVISVPERAQDQFVESQQNGVVAVLSPRDGSGPSRILQRPGSTPVGDVGDSLRLDTVDYDANGTALVSGRALPRAQVLVYLDDVYIGGVRADDEGRWTISSNQAFSAGDHILRVDQIIGGDGDVQLRIVQPFTTGGTIDQALQTGNVVVQPGNSLWHIARRIYGSGTRYTLIFQENDDQIGDPNLIYPGQLFEIPGYGGEGTGNQ